MYVNTGFRFFFGHRTPKKIFTTIFFLENDFNDFVYLAVLYFLITYIYHKIKPKSKKMHPAKSAK
jgi:hypothetical protein